MINPDIDIQTLLETTKSISGRWPYGMPYSYPAKIVFIGDTPGNSPDANDNLDYLEKDYSPVANKVHKGFYYRDGKGYWDKIRAGSFFIARELFEIKTEEEALSISAHFNCGIVRSGSASQSINDVKIINWINDVISNYSETEIVVLVGLWGKLSKKTEISSNLLAYDKSTVMWLSPDLEIPFYNYKVRLWNLSVNGRNVKCIATPNHPTRHPFAGQSGFKKWNEFLYEACKLFEIKN